MLEHRDDAMIGKEQSDGNMLENDRRLSEQWGTLQPVCKLACGGQILFALASLFV